jgi:RND family efflux transporter MFP subunit
VCTWWLTPVHATDLETITVSPAELPRVYRLDGIVEAVSRGTVSAQTSGRVVEVHFDVDDIVRKGDVIVTLEDTQQAAAVTRAKADLAAALSGRRDAEREYERIKGVFERDAVSKAEMDRVTALLERARAAEKAAAAALRQAEQELEYTRVRAPYNGVVTDRLVEVGEAAQPGQGLMSGFSLERMRVSVDVPQDLVPQIRRERQAQVRLDDEWIEAEEVTVFPVADPRSDTFEVRLDLPADVEGAFPGMYVKVGFVAGTERQLVLPRRSVVVRSEVVGVYTVDDDGQVFLRHVRLGSPAGQDHVIVLSGLAAGERVATDPVAAGILLKAQRMAHLGDE